MAAQSPVSTSAASGIPVPLVAIWSMVALQDRRIWDRL